MICGYDGPSYIPPSEHVRSYCKSLLSGAHLSESPQLVIMVTIAAMLSVICIVLLASEGEIGS